MVVNPYDGAGYGCGIGYGYCGAPSGAVPLLLDNLAATYGAWSVARKIRTAYSGSLIRVRESGGNTEADIPAVNGVLDEAALTSHVGANSGYITKIYNQDSNGSTLDFAQSTTTTQPIIVESGTIVKENGKPAAKFLVASLRRMTVPTSTELFKFLHNGTSSCFAVVLRPDDTAGFKFFLTTWASPGPGIECAITGAERLYVYATGTGITYTVNPFVGSLAAQSIISVFSDADALPIGNRVFAWGNGSQLIGVNTQSGTALNTASARNLTIGGYETSGVEPFGGTIQELIIWPTDETASREIWEADMADFYGVALA